MSHALAYPRMAVHTAQRNLSRTPPLYTARVHSYHFGPTSALAAARRLRLAGVRMVWIAGTKRAILEGAAKYR